MKNAVSPHALEIGRSVAQKKAAEKAANGTLAQEIPNNLRATFWFPDISTHQESYCQFYGCEKVFPLKEGLTYPLPIARMMDGELCIRSSPMLVFCSLQHLFEATVTFGAVVTEEGRVHSLVRH